LVTRKITVAAAVTRAPRLLMTARRRQPAGLVRRPVHDQPGLRQREAGEHADREQRDQRQGVAADRDQEHPGPGGQRPDAGAEYALAQDLIRCRAGAAAAARQVEPLAREISTVHDLTG
jgi:hypothetical protein